MTKHRSLEAEYLKWTIKEYRHWTLLVHEDQRYLGRAYAWLVREGGMQRFSEISDEEMAELRTLMREYEEALQKLWQPDFMNYAWLANLIAAHGGHGHMHLIPRYKDSRTFEGIEFLDGRWGMNYSPSESFKVEEGIMEKLRDTLKAAMS